MITIKKGDYTGYSDSGIDEAVQNALQKAGKHTHFEIIETRSSQIEKNTRHYQATVTAFFD
ncbi:dodecin domain-containing protein [Legionella fairfieldensis]|uniref:dodecin domain-containing protein n=1 Tax=Legionella fairfieldensis TaxID=45064 RepID=UPI00048ABD1A|nr:dodecin domain-containing protein [Legionella fairfieldensis]